MSASFFQRLEARCRETDSLLCIGLDPHPGDLKATNAQAAKDFCLRLIDATHSVATCFKPNSAFFEIYGAEGIAALQTVIAHADGVPVLLDAKRGDIDSTSKAYAQAAFQTLGADALTVSPYLGRDAIEPFIEDASRGVFLLCKTSNPGSADVQDLEANGRVVYIHVADLAAQWNTRDNVGLVVGATYPQVLAQVRAQVPDLWFLAPGVGTQGGDLEAAVAAGLRSNGMGLLLPVSRAISRAEDPAAAAENLRGAINAARAQKTKTPPHSFPNQQLADDLLRLGCVQFGEFKLKSGITSPIYIDLRRLVGEPAVLARAASAFVKIMIGLKFDRVAGLPYAALPIATAISLRTNWPLIYPRKETKEYGTKAAIEGPYTSGETAIIVDDLITTGGSKTEGIEKLKAAGLGVTDIVVLIDRRSQKTDEFRKKGIELHSVFDLTDLLSYWKTKGAVSPKQYENVLDFLQKG